MISRNRFLIFGLLGVAAGLATTTFLFTAARINLGTFLINKDQFPSILFLLFFLTGLNLVIRWLRWHYLIRRTRFQVPARESAALFASFLSLLVIPFYLGDLLRNVFLVRGERRALGSAISIWLIERLSDLLALAILIMAARRSVDWVSSLGMITFFVLVNRFTKTNQGNRSHRWSTVSGWVIFSSVVAWSLPVIGMALSLRILQEPIAFKSVAETFYLAATYGSLTPLGAGLSGASAIMQLENAGISVETALVSVLLFRAGTTWFAFFTGCVALFLNRHKLTNLFLQKFRSQQHFNDLAETYEQNIPTHIQDRLLKRKVSEMETVIENLLGNGRELLGLDIGCGHGWYAEALREKGYPVLGFDLSYQQVLAANARYGGHYLAANSVTLPFSDNSFDFSYAINVVHHITSIDDRKRFYSEIIRILKPGGLFFLQEINTENILFKFYMGYLFPFLRDIDDGTELWVRPNQMTTVDGGDWHMPPTFFNFMPDFMPQSFLPIFHPIEKLLENSPLRSQSSHYITVLQKNNVID